MVESVPFGRYKLLNLLGEGGMARVFRALMSGPMGFEKEVALKQISSKVTQDERVVRALVNEARLGGQLRHKNIVEIYEFDHVDEVGPGGLPGRRHYYLAMEYVNGWAVDIVLRTLRKRRQWMPPTVVVEIMAAVSEGLAYAHGLKTRDGASLNLVHRDLKPGNIILSRDGEAKLMDFGIAKADTNLYKTTAEDVTKGTPIYMSPEQVTGGTLDNRSDLFSMGSVLHELLTLQVPFQGDNLLAIMHAVLNARIDDAVARVRGRCEELVPVVERCMAKDRDARYPDAKALGRELRSIGRRLDGPSLIEWLEELEPHLPKARQTGDWGADGEPSVVIGVVGSTSAAGRTMAEGEPPQVFSLGEADSGAATGAFAVEAEVSPALLAPDPAPSDEVPGVGGMDAEVDISMFDDEDDAEAPAAEGPAEDEPDRPLVARKPKDTDDLYPGSLPASEFPELTDFFGGDTPALSPQAAEPVAPEGGGGSPVQKARDDEDQYPGSLGASQFPELADLFGGGEAPSEGNPFGDVRGEPFGSSPEALFGDAPAEEFGSSPEALFGGGPDAAAQPFDPNAPAADNLSGRGRSEPSPFVVKEEAGWEARSARAQGAASHEPESRSRAGLVRALLMAAALGGGLLVWAGSSSPDGVLQGITALASSLLAGVGERPPTGPAPVSAETPASESTPSPTPTPAPTPDERGPMGYGTVELDASPWANLFLDGDLIGQTPLKERVRAGHHRLEFQCGSCDPPQNRVIEFDLRRQGQYKRRIQFEQVR